MSVETSSAVGDSRRADFESIFLALPPLGSPEYSEFLEKASVKELPAQVLARAFRQLAAAGSTAAADATLTRLIADDRFEYLTAVHALANKHTVKGLYSYDPEDLVHETVMEIVRTLPTSRGEIAEGAWVLFIKHRFEDARRNLYGHEGNKDPYGRVEAVEDADGEFPDPIEMFQGSLTDMDLRQAGDDLPWLEELIRKTIAKIADPTIRRIAEDQCGDDPSPISKGKSTSDRLSLEEQLGLSRYQISRRLRNAKARVAAELIAQKERNVDIDWIRRFLKTEGRKTRD